MDERSGAPAHNPTQATNSLRKPEPFSGTTLPSSPALVVAVDVPTVELAYATAAKLSGLPVWLKIGLELFTACGPEIVRELTRAGFPVFLDLKFHDIPNTVKHAVMSAVMTGAGLITVHASGGKSMMQAAVAGRDEAFARLADIRPEARPPKLLAITVLTSTSATELGLSNQELQDLALQRAVAAQECGIDGVVCSGHEAAVIKQTCGSSFQCLCPGIRLAGAQVSDDQARVMTPDEAVRQGANYIVMGRPILTSAQPSQTVKAVLTLMQGHNS